MHFLVLRRTNGLLGYGLSQPWYFYSEMGMAYAFVGCHGRGTLILRTEASPVRVASALVMVGVQRADREAWRMSQTC